MGKLWKKDKEEKETPTDSRKIISEGLGKVVGEIIFHVFDDNLNTRKNRD